MTGVTFSGLKNSMNAKQNLITSSTNITPNSITVISQTYCSGEYNIASGNITIYSGTGNPNYTVIQSWNSQPLIINEDGGALIIGGTSRGTGFPLTVAGTGYNSDSLVFRYFTPPLANYNRIGVPLLTTISSIVAKFNSSIVIGLGLYISSDERIKTNIQDIDDDSALQLILKIQPKTYQYIDKFEKGDRKVYGFIAQQIRDVIPEAVTIQPEIIPNIYKIGVLSNSNVITMDTDISDTIKVDSNISLITSNIGKKEYKVTDVNSNQFKIDTDINDSNNVFVYGTKVNDFHVLDKNYIYTLNVCATQELYKMINEQNQQILELQDKYKNMSNNINLIINKINSIK